MQGFNPPFPNHTKHQPRHQSAPLQLLGALKDSCAPRIKNCSGASAWLLLPAARIRTNPVSLNGGVERAPPAR